MQKFKCLSRTIEEEGDKVKKDLSDEKLFEMDLLFLVFIDFQSVCFLSNVPLAVPSSSSARGENFSTINGVLLHIACHNLPPIVLI